MPAAGLQQCTASHCGWRFATAIRDRQFRAILDLSGWMVSNAWGQRLHFLTVEQMTVGRTIATMVKTLVWFAQVTPEEFIGWEDAVGYFVVHPIWRPVGKRANWKPVSETGLSGNQCSFHLAEVLRCGATSVGGAFCASHFSMIGRILALVEFLRKKEKDNIRDEATHYTFQAL